MINKEKEVDELNDLINREDMELAHRVKRITDYIVDKVQRNGEMTYYDEDVMFILKYFLSRSGKKLTATEMIAQQQGYLIHQEEIKHLKRYIAALREELQNQKEINKEEQKIKGNLQKRITELENILKGKSIHEMGISDLYGGTEDDIKTKKKI